MNYKFPIIAPSILAADHGKLEEEVRDVVKAGADWIHVDVMDGNFVPPITFGADIVRQLRSKFDTFLDVHLMIVNPEQHLETFQKAGSSRIIVHQEVCPHLHRTLTEIKKLGIANGVVINPGTPISTIVDVLDVCDLVLIMTVNPGWGGQPFIPPCLAKIRALRQEIDKRKLSTLIEVDGGIQAQTAKECVEAGAQVLVAGSFVFGSKDRSSAIKQLRGS